MATTPADDQREQAWKDSLRGDDLLAVQRLQGMTPAMAIAFVYIEMRKELQELSRPSWRTYLDHIGSGLSGGFIAWLAATHPGMIEKILPILGIK